MRYPFRVAFATNCRLHEIRVGERNQFVERITISTLSRVSLRIDLYILFSSHFFVDFNAMPSIAFSSLGLGSCAPPKTRWFMCICLFCVHQLTHFHSSAISSYASRSAPALTLCVVAHFANRNSSFCKSFLASLHRQSVMRAIFIAFNFSLFSFASLPFERCWRET